MDRTRLTRTALYLSLAVITYLMLLEWNEDYPPQTGNDDAAVASTPGDGNAAQDLQADAIQGGTAGADDAADAAGIPDIPSVATAPTSNASAGDLPALPPSSAPAVPNQPAADDRRLVEVLTDTVLLHIDLDGGDIVYLALRQHRNRPDSPDEPSEYFVLLESGNRTYIAQSGFLGMDSGGRAGYESAASNYRLADGENSMAVDLIHHTASGQSVTKRYTFHRGSYLLDIDFIVDNPGPEPWRDNLYGQLRRSGFDDPTSAGGFLRTFLGFVGTSPNDLDDPYIERDFGDIDERETGYREIDGWVGFNQQYFLSAWVPAAGVENQYTIRRRNTGPGGRRQYFGEFIAPAISAAAGGRAETRMQFYAGPKDRRALADIAPNLDLTIDYSFLWFLAKPIHWLLLEINEFVVNWGLSIIILTLIVKAVFYKLSETQYRSMAGMRRLMPKMQQLKESYGDDKMQLQKATMDLYKKEKINPFGGCLPILVQMPVFIALYWVLLESVELRHAPFFLWINDLSVRDPYFVLPILMGVTMYLQTAISPTPADPTQAKVMKLMPLMMTALFIFFPAGLVLYWLMNSLISILQQWYITRKVEAAYAAQKTGKR